MVGERLSRQTVAVLGEFVARPDAWRYGYDLMQETDLQAGTLYPILHRLSAQGTLERRWEDDAEPGRPRRQLYRLTPDGVVAAREVLHRAAARGWVPRSLLARAVP